MEKITAVFSSPRKESNSTALAEEVIKGAMAGGAEVIRFDLNKMHIRPCQACYACKKTDAGCVLQDEMQQIYPQLIASQGWIMATPIYWFNMTGQLKCFIDRLFALYHQDSSKSYFPNKKIAAAMSYGCEDPFESGCINAVRSIQEMAQYTGTKFIGCVHGCGDLPEERNPQEDGYLLPGNVTSNKAIMEKAFQLGQSLME